MAFVNYNNREITVKIVYYGPALSGKTTCLRDVFNSKEFKKKGKLITLDTDGDRTLFFDFLPIEIGNLGNYTIKIQLYTVPGQVAYNTTRKLVLQGADGIVFVADSQIEMREQNVESFKNLKENLMENNISFVEIPLIFQYNKRDLKEILPIDELNSDLNPENKPFFPTIATTGENIHEGLHTIMKMVIIYIKNKLTVFQKDKTVMFSRDEITSKSGKTPEEIVDEPRPGSDTGDTQDESIIELATPIESEDNESDEKNDEDIFDLENENLDSKEFSDIEIPEVEINREITSSSKEIDISAPIELSENEMISDKIDDFTDKESLPDEGEMTIPLDIKIPEGKKEFDLNLKLKIRIKK
ncbi:MAG: GTPase domain-containing protein [Acidobacteriota bacterium]